MRRRSYGPLAVALAVLVVFLYAAYEITTWSSRSRLFALTITLPAIALAAAQVGREIRRWHVPPSVLPEAVVARSALAWFAGFFASLWAIGLMATIPLFSVAYLRFGAREPLPRAAAYALAAWLFAYVLFDRSLHVSLPTGIVQLPAVP